MDLQISIDLNDAEKSTLHQVFLVADDGALQQAMQNYANAAIREYADMFVGAASLTSGTSFKEHRLLLIIEHAFGNRLPSEADVARLFQITPQAAKGLLQSTAAKYRQRMKDAHTETLRDIVGAATIDDEGPHTLTTPKANAISLLNDLLATAPDSFPAIKKKYGQLAQYELARSSYVELCRLLNLQRRDV
jgi:hypothetical protein